MQQSVPAAIGLGFEIIASGRIRLVVVLERQLVEPFNYFRYGSAMRFWQRRILGLILFTHFMSASKKL